METKSIAILPVLGADLEAVKDYVWEARKLLFPMLHTDRIPEDIACLKEFYLDNPISAMLCAKDDHGKLIGVAGMREYDYRFSNLDIPKAKVVEVARLFIDPDYRRLRLASKFVTELKVLAELKNIDVMYLHTHPFLSGAYEFWLKQGFKLDKICMESGFETIHMSLNLSHCEEHITV